jgi:transposase-like protein
LYRAVDQYGQVLDVLVSTRRDAAATRRFFSSAVRVGPVSVEVVTDRAQVYPRVLEPLVPAARHVSDRFANNTIEVDHDRLKARLGPMRGLKRLAAARTSAAGYALRAEPAPRARRDQRDLPQHDRVRVAFDELALSL